MNIIANLIASIMLLFTGAISPTPATTPPPKVNAMATPGELLPAINAYRTSHGLSPVTQSSTLCTIAQSRAHDQQAAGQLDNHAGFEGAAHSQSEFHHVGEILQYWDAPEDATYLVEKGWSRSGEHNAIMLDPTWTNGCGGVSGYYSVFIFARI